MGVGRFFFRGWPQKDFFLGGSTVVKISFANFETKRNTFFSKFLWKHQAKYQISNSVVGPRALPPTSDAISFELTTMRRRFGSETPTSDRKYLGRLFLKRVNVVLQNHSWHTSTEDTFSTFHGNEVLLVSGKTSTEMRTLTRATPRKSQDRDFLSKYKFRERDKLRHVVHCYVDKAMYTFPRDAWTRGSRLFAKRPTTREATAFTKTYAYARLKGCIDKTAREAHVGRAFLTRKQDKSGWAGQTKTAERLAWQFKTTKNKQTTAAADRHPTNTGLLHDAKVFTICEVRQLSGCDIGELWYEQKQLGEVYLQRSTFPSEIALRQRSARFDVCSISNCAADNLVLCLLEAKQERSVKPVDVGIGHGAPIRKRHRGEKSDRTRYTRVTCGKTRIRSFDVCWYCFCWSRPLRQGPRKYGPMTGSNQARSWLWGQCPPTLLHLYVFLYIYFKHIVKTKILSS